MVIDFSDPYLEFVDRLLPFVAGDSTSNDIELELPVGEVVL
jgi:hypothetical protein